MRLSLIFLLLTLATGTLLAETPDEWLTYYEKSGYLETPRYDETIDYCRRLADHSTILEFTSFGISPQGRRLPLLILDLDEEFDPQGPKTQNKAILLLEAGIHPGEIEGKDAGLMFLRDIVVNCEYFEMLENVVILFIPIFSVDGHERFGPYNRANQNGPTEMGWRTTAQNLNLNRDWLKADAPEMRFWLELFNRWLPDFLVDIHTSDGADYQYVITYAIEANTNVAAPLAQWTSEVFEPEIKERMAAAGFPFVRYIVPVHGHDITKGIVTWTATPRYSNGYGAAQNRPFLLIETHMLKDYRTRVESVYELYRQLTDYVNTSAVEIRSVMRQADQVTADAMTGNYFPFRYRPTEDSIMADFLGVEFHYEPSEVSGSDRIIWGSEKKDYRIPVFHRNDPVDSTLIPYAYLIPQEWQYQINLLQLHGVRIDYLTESMTLEVESCRFTEAKWRERPFEGRHLVKVETEPLRELRTYPPGTAVVLMNQRTNRIIAHLLEPRGPDSFVSWGFFNVIFERKEYIEDYVLEELAVQMLAEDSLLAAKFWEKVESDTAFAADPDERLWFFYERTPYYDQRVNIYPIGKLMEAAALKLE